MAAAFDVPYLGSLPMDANLTQACERGECFVSVYPSSPAVKPLTQIVDNMIDNIQSNILFFFFFFS
jgi:Flp pilus assembly CpaE family ATPase